MAVACGSPPPPEPAAPTAPPATDGPLIEATAEKASPQRAASLKQARASGEVELAFFFAPTEGFAYRDEGDRLTGVTIELLRDFARHIQRAEGIDVRIRWIDEPDWRSFYEHVKRSEGAAFGVGNVTITEERRDELDFSPPYLDNVAVLVTHESVPALTELEELGERFAGFRALVFPGTLHEARIDALGARHFPDLERVAVGSNDELLVALARDRRAFGYIDGYNYWRAVAAGAPLSRHEVADDASESFGVIAPRGSDWSPLLREFFEAEGGYAQSERFAAIMAEHLGAELAAMLRVSDGER